jgi:hypothetical protein
VMCVACVAASLEHTTFLRGPASFLFLLYFSLEGRSTIDASDASDADNTTRATHKRRCHAREFTGKPAAGQSRARSEGLANHSTGDLNRLAAGAHQPGKGTKSLRGVSGRSPDEHSYLPGRCPALP